MASLFRNLEIKTGKSIDTWVSIARASGLTKHKELVDFIKTNHNLTHGYAAQIAQRALAADSDPDSGVDALIEAQYAGAKSAVRPIHDAIVAAVQTFGNDVTFSPKKAYVSLRRTKQFGMIQPSTASRVDLGLILKGESAERRLELSGSFNAMFTHRVRVGSVAEVDEELIGWLKQA